MDEKWTWYSKQNLVGLNGLIYEFVWTIDTYSSSYEPMWSYRDPYTVSSSDFRVEYHWKPPGHLGTGIVRTRNLKDAIELGFLRLVAPVKSK